MKNHFLKIFIACLLIVACNGQNKYKKASQHGLNTFLWMSTETPWYGEFKDVQELVERGADIEYVDPDELSGTTPLLNAAGAIKIAEHNNNYTQGSIDSMETEAIKIVRYLVSKGANINSVKGNEYKSNAIHLAAFGGRARMIPVLVELGLDINSRDAKQLTPLIYATTSGNLKAVIACVENGANINAVGSDGNTALDIASYVAGQGHFSFYKEHKEIAKYLEEKGAKHGANKFGF